ncbi:hypothetical protein GE09DRAFT_32909 [Coniochaeta sp. 2T2.1]|nr:hypothetical protein GE09DRAFT_32909 [Coniochaeta sp. 2T2.1]
MPARHRDCFHSPQDRPTSSPVNDSAAPNPSSATTRLVPKCVHFGWFAGSDCTSSVFHSATSVHATASSTSGYSEYPSYSSGPKETITHSGTTRTLSTLRLAHASSSSSGTGGAVSTPVATKTVASSSQTTSSTGVHTTVATSVSMSSSAAGTITVKTTRTSLRDLLVLLLWLMLLSLGWSLLLCFRLGLRLAW